MQDTAKTAGHEARDAAQSEYEEVLAAWQERRRSARWKLWFLYGLTVFFVWVLYEGLRSTWSNGISVESIIVILVVGGLAWWPIEVARSVKRQVGRAPAPPN